MTATVTATAEPDLARIRLDVAGAPPGDALLAFRRDSAGVGVVRDTSEASLLPTDTVLRKNYAPNPSAEVSVAGWTAYSKGAPGSQVRQRVTDAVPAGGGTHAFELSGTFSAVADADRVGYNFVLDGVAPGDVWSFGTYARFVTTKTGMTVVLYAEWLDAAGTFISGIPGVNFGTAQTTYGQLKLEGKVAPANTAKLRVYVWLSGGTLAGAGRVYFDMVQVEKAATLGPYFDGSTPAAGDGTAARFYAWEGAAHLSASTEVSTAATIYDYEAHQGDGTDYILADPDGVQLAVADRVTVPTWGTWLKSPGRPFLNVRCYLAAEAGVQRPARRAVVAIEGSSLPVVLSETRLGARGSVQLLGLTDAMNTAIHRVLEDGAVLMLDTAPSWQVPFRYVSVGDEADERPVGAGVLGLDRAARVHTLADVVEVAAPIGVSVVNALATYDALPTLYGSYAAMAAVVPTYESLVL